MISEDSTKSLIRTNVASAIAQRCSCTFQEVYISGDDIICDDRYTNDIFYRANITSYGSLGTTQLTNHISNWITTSPVLTSPSYSIRIDSSCPVTYSSSDDPLCGLEETPSPTDSGGSIVVIIVAIAVPLIVTLLIVIVVIIVIITCCIKNGTK